MNKYLVKIICILTILIAVFQVARYVNNHNTESCYTNIANIKIGEDYKVAMETMSRNTIFLKTQITKELDPKNDSIIKVVFPYKDDGDVVSSCPIISYSIKTGKVVEIETGLFY
ncbi:MAG: hypothetical protein EOO46_03800 [Flavobacterium sp.]|nr:MAG: hypothetical protein EOO46_03800 [Flavobacterium sp.]